MKNKSVFVLAILLAFMFGWNLRSNSVQAQQGAQRIIFDSNPKDGTCPSNTVAVQPYISNSPVEILGWDGGKPPFDGILLDNHTAVIFSQPTLEKPVCIVK